MRKLLFFGVTSALLVAAGSGLSRAAEVLIENRSNSTIYVAMAYEKWKGDLATEGWTKIESNGAHTFRAPDASHLHLRVEKNGKEVTFTKHQAFLYWPASYDRFTVSKPSDDPSIRILRWGRKLEYHHNIRKDGKLPKGWQSKRFFHIGKGKHHLHINP